MIKNYVKKIFLKTFVVFKIMGTVFTNTITLYLDVDG